MRKIGEIVQLSQDLIAKYSKLGRSLERQKGFVLDEVEKAEYSNAGWSVTSGSEPYDIFNPDLFVDFKLCTSKSLTIQESEVNFGQVTPNYRIFLYLLEEDGLSACFVGQLKFSNICRYLQPSRDPSSSNHFCFLDEIQDLIF